MADNVAITAGSGTTIATDDVGGAHHQFVKLVDGTLNSSTVVPAGTQGLYVDPHPALTRIKVKAANLTAATTAYVSGDQLGDLIEFSNAARTSGSGGMIRSATLLSQDSIVGAVDLFLFDRSVTAAADNAANSFSDADMAFCQGILSFGTPVVSGANSLATIEFSGLSFISNATSLFAALVTRSDHTYFSVSNAITVSLVIEQV